MPGPTRRTERRCALFLCLGLFSASHGQEAQSPPSRPGDCVLPLPPGFPVQVDGNGTPPAPPALGLPTIGLPRLELPISIVIDPTDLLLSDLPVGGAGDDASMLAMIDRFRSEVDPSQLFLLAHQIHVQLTTRNARIWVIDPNGPARLYDCLTNDSNHLRRAFALVAISKQSGAAPPYYVETTDPYLRVAALRWLAPPSGIVESQAQKVVDRLLEDSHHAHAGVRAAAAKALGEWAFTAPAVAELKDLALHDLDQGVRSAALKALANVHSVEVRATLIEIWRMTGVSDFDRAAARAALEATGILPDEN